MIKFYLISIRRKSLIYFLMVILLFVICVGIFPSYDYLSNKSKEVSSIIWGIADTDSNISDGGKLAIIIDDFGQSRAGVKEMMSIDRHLTFAIMPFLENSQSDAETAHEKGYEVIVHLPMEANYGKLSWVGPKPILANLNEHEVQKIVRESFESVPYAVGANIHMGSRASCEESIVSSILDVIKDKGLYFVDSLTAEHPIAKEISASKGVLCFERDIFLDGNKPKEAIKKQLQKAEELALKKGKAIAIGHVGPEGGMVTAEAISEMIPEFDDRKVQLVFISELNME